jgi:hypothetical protein
VRQERLSEQALTVLQMATVDSLKQSVAITGKLERSLYEEVDEALTRCGGKWTKKVKAHVFPYDPAPLIQAILETGEMPPKNPTAFFPTPADVVSDLLSAVPWGWMPDDTRILEPSAGTGALLDAIRMRQKLNEGDGWAIDCCEVLELNRAQLRAKGYTVVAEDFLEYQPEEQYDLIVMNPPFSVEEDSLAYITHIEHAFSMLKNGGKLLAIAPPGFKFRQDKRSVDFFLLVASHGVIWDNPEGAFKESGTGVATVNIEMTKLDQSWRRQPYNGWPSWHAWLLSLYADQDRGIYDQLEKLAKGPKERLRAKFDELMATTVHEARKHWNDPCDPDKVDLDAVFANYCQEWELENSDVNGQLGLDFAA